MKTKLIGIVLVTLGIAAALVPLKFIDRGSMTAGVSSYDVKIKDDLDVIHMDIDTFRNRFPQYADMDGEELALRLHARYFQDMPIEDYKKIFLTRTSPSDGKGGGDPVMIRGTLEEIKPPDVAAVAVYSVDAANLELIQYRVSRIMFRYVYPLAAGVVLAAGGLFIILFSLRRKTAKSF